MIKLIRKSNLARDEGGATLVEFAMITPVFMLMLLGLFDLGYTVYIQSTLTGVVQHAARESALETGPAELAAIDQRVQEQIKKVSPNAVMTFDRTSYFDYNGVGQAEAFTDTNGNGSYDVGECFEDMNSNSNWDADIGADGIGGPNDIVLYTVTTSYDRVFPLWKMMGWEQENIIKATTVLKNQPYGDQSGITTEVICS